MSYKWVYSTSPGKESVLNLQEELNVPEIIAYLLGLRKIDNYQKAKSFFRPDTSLLYNPFLMQDMEAGACRLSTAIRNHERVVIYGDYDVDGTTGVSILYLFLKQFGLDVYYYIPHRFKEGYGINADGIRYAIQKDASLIVSVDCGITAIDEAKFAKQHGIDLIICDHHTVGEEIPDAVAVLNPKRQDCDYPFKGLSGAGVGFKLLQAVLQKLGLPSDIAYSYLDLVAISIASDIVPIVDENRVMMRKGLKLINSEPRTGIRALLSRTGLETGTVSTNHIVFSLGPRINAAGRMGDATTAVELMISETPEEAAHYAGKLESINKLRKDTDQLTTNQALEMLENDYDLESTSAMVLHHPEWHLGVIGIVASRLVDAHYRPTIMLSTVDGKVKGSARSIKGFNIYEALKQCEDLLEQFGGHEFAAGLTMSYQNLEEFRKRINEIARSTFIDSDFKPELEITATLNLNDINPRFWKLLSQFEPFGPGNARPVFVSRDICVEGKPAIVGNGHLKMKVRQEDSPVFDVIGFNMHPYEPLLRDCQRRSVDIAYVLEENHWNGRRSIQIRLKDIHVN